ncbi:MAG TPA: DeoR family transcriptional regulator, partial [Albitalea sp.]|nr:DeoR family transcriptional regulator [Albitalea sp.]
MVKPPRFAQERQQQIAQALRDSGRVEVAVLATRYKVSEDTIRRDLRLLAAQGLVQKTHGGAVALRSTLLPAAERSGLLAGAKRAIARAAATHVLPHQTLFID